MLARSLGHVDEIDANAAVTQFVPHTVRHRRDVLAVRRIAGHDDVQFVVVSCKSQPLKGSEVCIGEGQTGEGGRGLVEVVRRARNGQ